MNLVSFLPPAWDRAQRSSEDNIPFTFVIKSVENIPKISTAVEDTQLYYVFQLHLYDAVYKQFFGRMCRGGIRKQNDESEMTNFKDDFYFHTCFCDENVLLVIELLQIANSEKISVGWTSLRLFKQNEKGLSINNGAFSLDLFHGSCYSLIFIDTTPDFYPSSEKILNCQVDVSLSVYKPLLKILHLIPENYVISHKELIPGVKNSVDNSCTLKGMRKLKKISLKTCTSCTLQDLNINIGATIDEFETEFCRCIVNENGKNISDVEVSERRLQIGFHNGWDFIEEPHTYHLVAGLTKESATALTRTSSGKRHNWSFRSKQSRNFILRNKIVLHNIPMESGISVLFTIEYVVNITSSDSKSTGSRNLNVAVFGARWEIFPECYKSPIGSKDLRLNNGNEDEIDKLLKILFYNFNRSSKEMPNIKFSYQIGKKNKSKSRLSIESSYSDSVSTQTNASIAFQPELNEQIELPTPQDVSDIVKKIPQSISPMISSKLNRIRGNLPRSLHSYLSNESIFPPILDRWNQPATLIDLQNDEGDLFTEEKDLLKSNEIILQFLAFQRINQSKRTRAVAISFQFFKFDIYFTPSLFLEPNNSNKLPCSLKQMENGGLKQITDIRFLVDPSDWKHNTHSEFLYYLNNYHLQFDVFDAESQFYLGQCSTPLKNLCRGGHEAVQFTQELEIILPLEPNPNNAVQLLQMENRNQSQINGYLYCRLGNVGQLSNPVNKFQIPVNIVKSDTWINDIGATRITKARSLRDVNKNDEIDENWEEKLRKLKRMEIVRAVHPDEKAIKLPQSKLSNQIRSLKTVQLWREEKKHESIVKILHENLTIRHSINVNLGDVEFFEFSLTNPFSNPVTVTVDIDDPDLKLINSPTEWEFLKRLTKCLGSVEEGLVSYESSNNLTVPQIFLHANESVNIPFKFQTFKWNTNYKVLKNEAIYEPLKMKKHLKVKFNSHRNSIICVLLLDVHIFHPLVENNCVLFQEAETKLQRCIYIPAVNFSQDDVASGNVNKQIYAVCSDSTATTDIITSEDLKRTNLVLKVSVGSVGNPICLFIFLYTNYLMISPTIVWRISVVPFLRIDMTCTLGQTRKCHLVVKGDNVSRKATCYLSDDSISIDQTNLFLNNNQTQQLNVNVKNDSVGYKTHFVNLVDSNEHSVIQSWILCVTTNPPIISKVFKVDLQLRKEANKKINFINQYAEARVFNLHCSHPNVMKIKDSVLKLAPKQKAAVALYFLAMAVPGPSEILLFIDNENGKNEDIYKIQIIYNIK